MARSKHKREKKEETAQEFVERVEHTEQPAQRPVVPPCLEEAPPPRQVAGAVDAGGIRARSRAGASPGGFPINGRA